MYNSGLTINYDDSSLFNLFLLNQDGNNAQKALAMFGGDLRKILVNRKNFLRPQFLYGQIQTFSQTLFNKEEQNKIEQLAENIINKRVFDIDAFDNIFSKEKIKKYFKKATQKDVEMMIESYISMTTLDIKLLQNLGANALKTAVFIFLLEGNYGLALKLFEKIDYKDKTLLDSILEYELAWRVAQPEFIMRQLVAQIEQKAKEHLSSSSNKSFYFIGFVKNVFGVSLEKQLDKLAQTILEHQNDIEGEVRETDDFSADINLDEEDEFEKFFVRFVKKQKYPGYFNRKLNKEIIELLENVSKAISKEKAQSIEWSDYNEVGELWSYLAQDFTAKALMTLYQKIEPGREKESYNISDAFGHIEIGDDVIKCIQHKIYHNDIANAWSILAKNTVGTYKQFDNKQKSEYDTFYKNALESADKEVNFENFIKVHDNFITESKGKRAYSVFLVAIVNVLNYKMQKDEDFGMGRVLLWYMFFNIIYEIKHKPKHEYTAVQIIKDATKDKIKDKTVSPVIDTVSENVVYFTISIFVSAVAVNSAVVAVPTFIASAIVKTTLEKAIQKYQDKKIPFLTISNLAQDIEEEFEFDLKAI